MEFLSKIVGNSLLFAFAISVVGGLTSCGNSEQPLNSEDLMRGEFKLNVIDEGKWLIYDRDDVYEVGDIIKFHTYVHPIKIDMYVDGEFYSSGTRVSINENNDYIEYRYVMPSKEVTVEFKTDLIKYTSFLNLYPWLGRLQYREVNTLVIEQGALGIENDEPEVITHKSASVISGIEEALYDMDVCNVKADSPLCAPVEGGTYIRYTFITETNTYEIYIENRRLETDDKIYLIYGEYPTE